MKQVLLVIFIIVSTFAIGQHSYPIQTRLKGDSVVIYTVDQSIDLNLTIENQRALSQNYKKQADKYRKEADSLARLLGSQKILKDSIQKLNTRIFGLEKWIVTAAIDNSYIYMSWQDNKVKVVDLTIYEVHCSMQTGTLRMVPRGDWSDYDVLKMLNYSRRESPKLDWELKYPVEVRPLVKNLPFDLKIDPYIR